jgi:glycosyltransferase involved in cell wall biosynthesis
VPEVLLLCAGGGPLARALPALVEAAGWAGQVRFLGPREDLPTLLAAADLVALASDREGLPLAILEAMAAARAVVATEVGGIAEVLSDGTTGRLVPPRVPAALADALADVLLDPAIRDAMGSQAHAVAVRRFSLDAAARRVEAIYSHELARRGGRLEAPRSGAKPWDERPARIDPDLSAGLGMALR